MATPGPVPVDDTYRLADRFERTTGRVYLTGWDALVRLPLMQRQRDVSAGLNTAGFVSGYPGSPLGGLDSLLRAQRAMLAERHVHFEPGLNEDLAATSIWGTQNLGNGPVRSRYDGVFGMWYGKGPGVERSTDAMRTANFQGVAQHGGVLAIAGDDHNARSTVTAQQSETLFIHMQMPVLNPATVQEYLDYGLAGWALSRFASTWVGFIALNDTADSAATVDVDSERPQLVLPEGVATPPPMAVGRAGEGVAGGLSREREIRTLRLPAAQAFVRANGLDRVVVGEGAGSGRLGVVTSGKTYLDVLDALSRLGLTPEAAADLGIKVYKVAMPWPLEPEGMAEFAASVDEVLVVEPKHPVMEDQIARLLRRLPDGTRPRLVGKDDETGAPLVPSYGALDATIVSRVLQRRLEAVAGPEVTRQLRPRETIELLVPSTDAEVTGTELVRAAGFCSGCPHSTGTRVPDGSFAIGGTGCHGMAAGLPVPGRETHHFTHMGGEGALWIGMAPFAEQSHIFQNMGDGTYSHSGALAIRAAIAAGVTMTFKVLLNGYISMTGGQAIPGGLSAQQLAAQVLSEGVRRVVVVSDDIESYKGQASFPAGVPVHDREELLAVEEELRTVEGVSVLVYDQACAAELRRERKRGRAVDPDKRTFIHETVCEGCGDCNVQSNCISVEPLDTDLGRKRRINQSTCNKDFTCVTGYCPSFVTLYGATPRRRGRAEVHDRAQLLAELPIPPVAGGAAPYNVLVGGIGGGGVLTIGALVGMAAHLEGKAASVLNESGLAQKNGAVQSHVRVAGDPDTELSPRIGAGASDLVLGADILVVAGAGPLATMDAARTSVVVNQDVRPTVAFSGNGRLDLSSGPLERRLRRVTGDRVETVAADGAASDLMGDSIYANLFLLGFAAQRGLLPVSVAAMERAIELNGVAVEANREAFSWGRLAAHAPERVAALRAEHGETSAVPVPAEAVADLIARRSAFLADYQDRTWAERYETAVQRVAEAEGRVVPGDEDLTRAVAENLFKLMAYKDEYEVARLYLAPEFRTRLEDAFEGDYRVKVNLAPQIFNKRDRGTGRARKWEIPLEIARPAFSVLARAKRLRGTPLDVFGKTAHRRAERARIDEYLAVLDEVTAALAPVNHRIAVQVASLPESIRGFDTIKDESAERAREKEAVLLDEFRALATTSAS